MSVERLVAHTYQVFNNCKKSRVACAVGNCSCATKDDRTLHSDNTLCFTRYLEDWMSRRPIQKSSFFLFCAGLWL